MSDTLAGLQKYHSSSPYISQVEQRLTQTEEQNYQHVNHLFNEMVKFEYVEKGTSNHTLINAIATGKPVWRYHLNTALSHVIHRAQYPLHSQ